MDFSTDKFMGDLPKVETLSLDGINFRCWQQKMLFDLTAFVWYVYYGYRFEDQHLGMQWDRDNGNAKIFTELFE